MATWEQVINRMAASLGYDLTAEDVYLSAMMAFVMEPPRAAGWSARVKARIAELRAAGWNMDDIALSGVLSDRLARWYGFGNDARLEAWHALPPDERLAVLKRIREKEKRGEGSLESAIREETKKLVYAYTGISETTTGYEDQIRWMEEEESGESEEVSG